MVHDSSPLIAVPRPPGSISSGRFAVLANGEQHDDTPVDPIGPTEPDANSTAFDSVCQESGTESVLSEGISEVPESVGTVGNPSEVVESEFETPVPFPSQCPHQRGICIIGHCQCPGYFFAEGLRDEGTSSILQRRMPFSCESRCRRFRNCSPSSRVCC